MENKEKQTDDLEDRLIWFYYILRQLDVVCGVWYNLCLMCFM